jgi:hypothetical protein
MITATVMQASQLLANNQNSLKTRHRRRLQSLIRQVLAALRIHLWWSCFPSLAVKNSHLHARLRPIAKMRKNPLAPGRPRTPEGKKRSRRNSLKHGLCAHVVVVDDADSSESRAEYDRLHRDLVDHFQPVGGYMHMLVRHLTNLFWKERREAVAERGLIKEELVKNRHAIEEGPFWATLCPDFYLRQMRQPGAAERKAERDALKDQHALPLDNRGQNLVRYRNANQQAIKWTIAELRCAEQSRRQAEEVNHDDNDDHSTNPKPRKSK